MKKKILITGGTGYIGSHTAVELIKDGFEVIIVDNLSNSNLDVLNGIEEITGMRPVFEKFDLCDKKNTSLFFEKHNNIDAIVHFAAFKAVGESVSNPLKYYHNNLVSLMNILECMVNKKIKNLVFSSSCTVYGQPEKLPVDETAPFQKANSPYGNTKQISEEIIQDFIKTNSFLKTVSLRYFNPIGAHESGLIGELPLGVPDNLVPFITQTAIGIRKQLQVFGDDYNTPDGTCLRDYIHVVDLAKAHISSIKRLLMNNNKSGYEIFNLGTGKGNSVFEVINTFEKVTGEKINYRVVNRRPGDIEQIYASTSYANSELNWKTELTLGNALYSAWIWEKNYRNKTKK
ncbi:MAG: UDP-glucose 4-epimerase GalE [Bacteroidales bacterium]|nr:UDP-glucose 4-epimerase GalE [Bacteroidales bacterium]